jgi:excisionase family DNA binding protein
MDVDKLEQVYTVADVARALKVKPQTVYAMIADKRLRAGKVGRLWRIPSVDVQSLLAGVLQSQPLRHKKQG